MEILEHTESATIRGDGLSGSGGNGKSMILGIKRQILLKGIV
jgi:hypothetical protein